MKKFLYAFLVVCLTLSLCAASAFSSDTVTVKFVSNDVTLGTINVNEVQVTTGGTLAEIPLISENVNAAFTHWEDEAGVAYNNKTLATLKFTENTTITGCFEKNQRKCIEKVNDDFSKIASYADSDWSTILNSGSATVGVSDERLNVSLPVATSGQTVLKRTIDGAEQGNYTLEMVLKKNGNQGYVILDCNTRALLMSWTSSHFYVGGVNVEMKNGVEYKLKLCIDGYRGTCDVYWNNNELVTGVDYSGVGVTALYLDMSNNASVNEISVSKLVVERELELFRTFVKDDFSKLSGFEGSEWIENYIQTVEHPTVTNGYLCGIVPTGTTGKLVIKRTVDGTNTTGKYYVEITFKKTGYGYILIDCGTRALTINWDDSNIKLEGKSVSFANNTEATLKLYVDGYKGSCDAYLNDTLIVENATYSGTSISDIYVDIDVPGTSFSVAKATVYKAVETISSITNPEDITVGCGGNFEILSNLPSTVTATLSNGLTTEIEVKWDKGNYNGQVAGTYTLNGELTESSYIINDNDLKAQIKIIVDASKPLEFTYSNPYAYPSYMYGGNGLRDPYILKVEDTYYLTGTQPDHGYNTGGTTIWKSKNLKDWTYVCNPIVQPDVSEGKWYCYRFWAPEIFEHNGKYYYAVACTMADKNTTGMALLVADDIEGPYTMLTEETYLVPGIDATFYKEEDGRVYMYWSHNGMNVCEIDLNTGRLIGETIKCLTAVPGDNFASSSWSGVEGPYVVKRDGIYYLFFSVYARGYETGYATATNPLGPWIMNMEPVFGSMSESLCEERGLTYDPDYYENNFRDTGHISVFVGPDGNDWLAGHTIVAAGNSPTMSIDPVEYSNGSISVIDGEKRVHGPTMGTKSVEFKNPQISVIKALDTHFYLVAGESYTLPEKADVLLSNGWKDSGNVVWEAKAYTTKAGTKEINGVVSYGGNSYNCKAILHVSEDNSAYTNSFNVSGINKDKVIIADVNSDSKISLYDAVAVLKHAAGIEIFGDKAAMAADLDGNNAITVGDALMILKYIARLINNF